MRTKPNPNAAAYGIDIGKKVFHVVAMDASGQPIQRAKFARETLLRFFEAAGPVLIGMEACAGSQWLARKLIALGHDAKIIPAKFVKAYVKSNKSDTIDAEAIAEAVTRPTMRFVQVRSDHQVDLQALAPQPGPSGAHSHWPHEPSSCVLHRVWLGDADRCRWLSIQTSAAISPMTRMICPMRNAHFAHQFAGRS